MYPALQKVDPDFAARLYGYGRHDDRAYEVWEYIKFGSLSEIYTDKQNDLDFIISEANYFQEIGAGYNTWSLFYYNQDLGLGDIYRSNVPANIDSVYLAFLNHSYAFKSSVRIAPPLPNLRILITLFLFEI